MASQLLAADASIAKTTSESFRSCFPPTRLSLRFLSPVKLCAYLHPGSPFSCLSPSSSSLILQLDHPGYGGREARVFCVSRADSIGFVGQETCALSLGSRDSSTSDGSRRNRSCCGLGEARFLHQGTERKRILDSMGIHGSAESMLSHRRREVRVSHSMMEGRVCHGLGPHHGSTYTRGLHGDDTGNKKFCQLTHAFLRRSTINVCRCILASFLKKGFFGTENDEKQRQQERQRALLSLCVQAMVASHMAQSPLLSFLWTKWPSMVDELCAAGQGGGKKYLLNGKVDCTREPDNASSFQLSLRRVLLIGFIVGAVIVMAINLPMSAGPLLDASLWLCLLCSLLFLAAWIVRALFCMAMFISKGGIMELHKRCTRDLQHWVGTSFRRGFLAGANIFWLNGAPNLLVSSLWSRLSTKIEGKRMGGMKRGRIGHFGFLQNMLSKQSKL